MFGPLGPSRTSFHQSRGTSLGTTSERETAQMM
jgi:hypothetical protein